MFANTEDTLEKGRMLTAQQAEFVKGLEQKFKQIAKQAINKKQFNLAIMMVTKAQLCNELLPVWKQTTT